MKVLLPILFAALLVALLLPAISVAVASEPSPATQPVAKVHIYKYAILSITIYSGSERKVFYSCTSKKIAVDTPLDEALDAMGEDGWELVSVTGGGSTQICYFKK
jgi:hypothetical protein